MKRLLPALFILPFLFTSCKKRREVPAPTIENIAGIYKITSIASRDAADQPEYDSFADDEPCTKDNLFEFKQDNTVICTDAGMVCDPPYGWTQHWTLEGNTITIGFSNGTVTKFTGAELEITLNWGEAYDRITYMRQ